MRKTSFMVLVVFAVLVAAACKDSPTLPSEPFMSLKQPVESEGPVIGINNFVGTWQATKAEGWSAWDPAMRRDLVAEGGKVILVLKASQMYTVTVTMPGAKPGIDTGRWYYHEFWGSPQIDFYPSSIPDPEYGEIPSFYVSLSDNTLSLSSGSGKLLPVDLGLYDPNGCYMTVLNLVLSR